MFKVWNEQDPASTMQKTCLTNDSSFLVWSGLETWKEFHLQSTAIFLWNWPFFAWWRRQTTKGVILEQACSWPVRRQSFAKYIHKANIPICHFEVLLHGVSKNIETQRNLTDQGIVGGLKAYTCKTLVFSHIRNFYKNCSGLCKRWLEWHWPSIPIGNWGFAVNLKEPYS